MIGWLSKLVTGGSDRDVRRLMPTVDRINALESAYEALSDEELRGKTVEFRRRLGTLPPEGMFHMANQIMAVDELSSCS